MCGSERVVVEMDIGCGGGQGKYGYYLSLRVVSDDGLEWSMLKGRMRWNRGGSEGGSMADRVK